MNTIVRSIIERAAKTAAQSLLLFVGAAQGAQAQQTGGFVKRGIGLNDPFAPTGANEVAGLEMCGGSGHGVF